VLENVRTQVQNPKTSRSFSLHDNADEQPPAPKKKSGAEKTSEYRKKEIMYIRHRIQKALLDKSGKEPDADVL
jgi:hypothetical protein